MYFLPKKDISAARLTTAGDQEWGASEEIPSQTDVCLNEVPWPFSFFLSLSQELILWHIDRAHMEYVHCTLEGELYFAVRLQNC